MSHLLCKSADLSVTMKFTQTFYVIFTPLMSTCKLSGLDCTADLQEIESAETGEENGESITAGQDGKSGKFDK